MSGWKIIGVTDECTECEVCGKPELRSTVLIEFEDGSQLYAGSTCAARKVGVKSADMRGAIKSYNLRFQVARSNFPDYFRRTMQMTVETYLHRFPESRKVAEGMYRRYMEREGFTV
jgi:hypothetical protein